MRDTKGNRRLLLSAILVSQMVAFGACKKEHPTPPATAHPREAPLFPRQPVASASSFDLVATSDGAVLVWAPRDASRASVVAMHLDAQGHEVGARVIVDARPNLVAEEVVAAASAGRLGVGWIERGSSPRARGTFGSVSGAAFAPPMDLGESVAASGATRGRAVLAATEEGALTMTFRIPRDDCYARSGVCERYMHRRLDRGAANPIGPMDLMEVLEPCEPFLFGSVWTSGTGYSGVCSTEETAMIPVIVVRPSISYAAPNPGPPGCTPIGITALPNGAVTAAQCDGTRVFREMNLEGRTVAQVAANSPTMACAGAHLTLSAGSEITLPLGAPQSRIELMLPTNAVGTNGRAVWTGGAVLLAREIDGALVLSRYACVDGRVVSATAP